ncbi:G-protein coupled receptor GRL101-like [Palaemon carinicauda]|uniref:G-protein coupled receptor GRL101-like n=1 Tax=Palaemon carinicauda TaxID=392227 RepID=UPI0035B5FE29
MYWTASSTSAAVRTDLHRRESSMARRMTLIVATDAACWLPIICLGIVSLAGVRIPPQVFAWVAVFVLPLNAAVNPLLYTLTTTPFVGKARERAMHVRRSMRRSVIRRTLSTSIGGGEPTYIARPIDICPASGGRSPFLNAHRLVDLTFPTRVYSHLCRRSSLPLPHIDNQTLERTLVSSRSKNHLEVKSAFPIQDEIIPLRDLTHSPLGHLARQSSRRKNGTRHHELYD